jgi:hypothetical protein
MTGKAAGSGERTDKIFTDLAKAQRLATKSHLVNGPVSDRQRVRDTRLTELLARFTRGRQ